MKTFAQPQFISSKTSPPIGGFRGLFEAQVHCLWRFRGLLHTLLFAFFLTSSTFLFAQEAPATLTPAASSSIIDTAKINAMKDSISWRLTQFFDIDMLEKCLEVRQISNLKGLSLLKKNKTLSDTIDQFEKDYQTNIFVNSYINSSQLWPRLLFNKDKTTGLLADSKNLPAVGFDIRFTPQVTGSNRVFKLDILNKPSAGLLDSSKESRLLQATNQGLNRQFDKVAPNGKDTANLAMFRGIATLRGLLDEQTTQCNINQVTFEPCAGQAYGFDVIQHDALKTYYEELTINGRPYKVPWKSIGTNNLDSVRVKLVMLDKNASTHKINFRSADLTLDIKPTGDGTYLISFKGGADKTEQAIEAYYTDTLATGKAKEHIIGKLKIRSYTPITKKSITPIILNGANFDVVPADLEKILNSIYKQAAVTWKVNEPKKISVNESVWDKDKNGILQIEVTPYQPYSDEMQAIIDAVGKMLDPNIAYMVITDLPNNYNYAGYMPLQSQFGFLFTNNFNSTMEGAGAPSGDNPGYHIIAHELGHGTFCMEHIEDEYKILDATDNLMNGYVIGKALWEPQWQWIADPSWRFYMFQTASQTAMQIAGEVKLKNALQEIGINACAFCKKCDILMPLDGRMVLMAGGKNLICTLGRLKDDGTIESKSSSTFVNTLSPIPFHAFSIPSDIDQFVVLVKSDAIVNICQANQVYGVDYCTKTDPFSEKSFTDKVIADIQSCAQNKTNPSNWNFSNTLVDLTNGQHANDPKIKSIIDFADQLNASSPDLKFNIVLTNSDIYDDLIKNSTQTGQHEILKVKIDDNGLITKFNLITLVASRLHPCLDIAFAETVGKVIDDSPAHSAVYYGYYCTIKTLLCISQDFSGSDNQRFLLGFINGLLQQIDITGLDAFIDKLEKNKSQCDYFRLSTTRIMGYVSDEDIKNDLDNELKCMYGISLADAENAGRGIVEYLKDFTSNPYKQGQVAAFVVTIIITPEFSELRLAEIAQLGTEFERLSNFIKVFTKNSVLSLKKTAVSWKLAAKVSSVSIDAIEVATITTEGALTELVELNKPISTEITSFSNVSYNFSGKPLGKGTVKLGLDADGNLGWKVEEEVGTGSSFKEITIDITTAIDNKINHIASAELVVNAKGYRLTGVHSQIAENEIFIVTKQGNSVISRVKTSDYILDIQQVGSKSTNGVYEAKVTVKDLNGNIIVTKSGNNGVSTFFPDNWSKVKIQEEVEHAIRYNKGLIDPNDASKGFYGFSIDGSVKIGFYYQESEGVINSFFPILNP